LIRGIKLETFSYPGGTSPGHFDSEIYIALRNSARADLVGRRQVVETWQRSKLSAKRVHPSRDHELIAVLLEKATGKPLDSSAWRCSSNPSGSPMSNGKNTRKQGQRHGGIASARTAGD
jgi:hypothetical protein